MQYAGEAFEHFVRDLYRIAGHDALYEFGSNADLELEVDGERFFLSAGEDDEDQFWAVEYTLHPDATRLAPLASAQDALPAVSSSRSGVGAVRSLALGVAPDHALVLTLQVDPALATPEDVLETLGIIAGWATVWRSEAEGLVQGRADSTNDPVLNPLRASTPPRCAP
jgi:hypothetical protein